MILQPLSSLIHPPASFWAHSSPSGEHFWGFSTLLHSQIWEGQWRWTDQRAIHVSYCPQPKIDPLGPTKPMFGTVTRVTKGLAAAWMYCTVSLVGCDVICPLWWFSEITLCTEALCTPQTLAVLFTDVAARHTPTICWFQYLMYILYVTLSNPCKS